MASLEAWCRSSPTAAAKGLKLGPKSIDELGNNVFADAPLMPAIDRYTGVLYSATGAMEWTAGQREWAAGNIFIHSALFGIVSSCDEIPAYRLSYDTKVRQVPLSKFWHGHVSDAIRELAADDWVLDCRSEGYRKLAPIPGDVPSAHLEVVSADGGKALNHFNKIHKGELVNALVTDMPILPTPEALVDWSRVRGISMSTRPGIVTLAI
ncbi:MAG: hypothetical protein RLZZ587_628 [Actinomycetota bacterium]|jgi:cytoplasmic iron level regulating protein YaaA (DUF328/UPF0246 family)